MCLIKEIWLLFYENMVVDALRGKIYKEWFVLSKQDLYLCFIKAWLLRLWEVTAPRGLIVIVNNADVWNKETLEPQLSNRYNNSCHIQYSSYPNQSLLLCYIFLKGHTLMKRITIYLQQYTSLAHYIINKYKQNPKTAFQM